MGNNQPPWSFKGLCLTIFYLVPARQVRSIVPLPLKVIEVAPGLTLGGIYAARYGKGGMPTLSEFGILPAYVGFEGKKGFFMHDFLSDNKECPEEKEARFAWTVAGKWLSLEVASGGFPLITIRMRPLIREVPISASFPFLCLKGHNVAHIRNHYASNIGISSSTVTIPDNSPLKGLPFRLKLVSTFWDASNIVVKEPEFLAERVIKRTENVLGTPIGKQT